MSDKAVSLYIHIPFCISKCNYCDFFSVPVGNQNAINSKYIDALCNEICYRLNECKFNKLKTVYIGGGTPSLLKRNDLIKLSNLIKKIGLEQNYEFSFEVNPDDITEELLQTLDECGINRISCGIQSFSDNALKKANRRAHKKTVLTALDLLQTKWHKNLSVDLICGLPGETKETLMQGLELLTKMKIPHISFYSLCVETETPLGQAINGGSIEYDFDFADHLWLTGRDFLISNGYVQYEVSNFCKPGFECIHNMTYWSHENYIGCGAGGTGTVYNIPLYGNLIEKKGEGVRYTNNKNVDAYIKFWNKEFKDNSQNAVNIPQSVEKIIHSTSKFEYFMMGLRTKKGINVNEYEHIFGEKIPDDLLKKLEIHCTQTEAGHFYMNEQQILFLNKFLEEIL